MFVGAILSLIGMAAIFSSPQLGEPFGLFIILGLLMTGILFTLLGRPIYEITDFILGLVGAQRF